MKIDREKVYNKFDGHCAYCGDKILIKEMQVDHIIPKNRQYKIDYDLNHIKNLNPSCRTCNHYKRAEDLEGFRWLMSSLHKRVCAHYIGKVAIKYGIAELKPFDGKFYFEKLTVK